MLFQSALAPGRGIYVQQVVCQLGEGADCGHMQAAWQATVAAHPGLRVGFPRRDDRPVVVVVPDVALAWEVVDGTEGAAAADSEAWFERWLARDRERDFDPAEAPLMRLAWLRLGAVDTRLVWTFHHGILDGGSHAVVLAEVLTRYAALREGRAEAPSLRTWPQLAAPTPRDAAADAAFWRAELVGFAVPTPLDFTRVRTTARADGESGGAASRASLGASLPEAMTTALRALARAEGFSLGTLVVAAWGLVLGRYAGQAEVVVGTTRRFRAGAGDSGNRPPLGLLINTVPLRIALPGDALAVDWLRAVRARWTAARDYLETPPTEIQRASELAPNIPLFETIVMYDDQRIDTRVRRLLGPGGPGGLGAVTLRQAPHYPLALCAYGEASLALEVDFDAERFDAATVRRLVGHVQTVLAALARDAGEARLDALAIVPPDERAALLALSSGPVQGLEVLATDTTLAATIEAQIDRTPDATALVFEGQTMTFATLEQRANQVAHRLRALGAGPETLVALAIERSFELLVGILGVAKSGAAFVPLDPRDPDERLRFALEDTRAPIVLTQARFAERFSGGIAGAEGLHVLSLDGPDEALTAASQARPEPLAGPRDAAYVMYTSGSTGRPKGVVVEHRAILNHVLWRRSFFALAPDDRVLQKTPYTFDVSLWELLWPLTSGHPLVLAVPDGHRDPAYLVRLIRDARITTLHFVPAMLQAFVEARGLETLGCIRRVCLSGEAISAELVERFFKRLPHAELWNLYGPTEAAIEVSVWQCTPGSGRALIPMGRPIANTQLYVLDRTGEPAPLGVPGELFIAGTNVARGYLGRPELTAERFVSDPFAADPGRRMYRTGDRARWLADGNMEFLGRLDDQVKIRGVRVEPGEVEATLITDAELQIREAAVVVRPGPDGAPRLVAYVVPRAGSLDVRATRERLKARLPEAYLPSVFVTLDALPLTSSGKLDRKALPEPDHATGHQHDDDPPQTPTEALIAEVFADVLDLATVPRSASFFDCGGHSLLAAVAVTRIARAAHVELSLRAIFDAPTVASLAVHVDRVHAALHSESTALSATAIVAEAGPPILSLGQERFWFLDQLGGEPASYHLSFALRVEGALDATALGAAFEALVRRHEPLRTVVVRSDGRPVAALVPAPPSAGRVAEPLAPEALAAALQAHTRQPFDLANDAPIRLRLFRLAPNRHVLSLVLHHLAVDGWSIEVMFRELPELYEAALQQRPASLPPLPIRYTDFARWQRDWVRSDAIAPGLSYWREHLTGAPAALELPLDHVRPRIESFRGDVHHFHLPAELITQLRAVAATEGATLFMALLAAFQTLLARLSGQDDIVVGTAMANRGRAETESLVGFFVNTLALRTRLDGDPTFREALRRARQTALGAYAHQDVPFEKVVEALAPVRALDRSPIFQVMLLLQPAAHTELAFEGLSITRDEVHTETSKFDLTLSLVETPTGLDGTFEYAADLFTAPTIARFAQHFATLCAAACEAPDTAIGRLRWLRPDERAALLALSTGPVAALATDTTLAATIEAQIDRTPDATALVFEGRTMTFATLEQRANQVAHRLRALGAGPETLVALALERSFELLVGILGVAKSGAAFVPLDPRDPDERLRFALEDTRAPIVLTQARFAERFAGGIGGGGGLHVLSLDAPDEALTAASQARPESLAGPRNAAYVMYTSGSTGRPKGVIVEHRAILNHVLWRRSFFALAPDDRVLQKTPYTFDVSLWELLWPLTSGHPLVLAVPDGHRDPAYLVRRIRDEQITTLHFVPSMLQAFVEARGLETLGCIRRVYLSGEAISAELVERFFQRLPHAELWNLYGPTEAAIEVSVWQCTPGSGRALIPMGRPIANTQLYVLDRRGEPAPLGVPGELFIAGTNVARGYLGRAELTAERFVVDPFAADPPDPDRRMYRTGDRARWLADGNLEFLGRLDHQVKIRGVRVEPGEVEATLLTHAELQVREAAVVVRPGPDGAPRLVAYVVPRGPALDARDLRRRLKERLPEAYIPSAFVALDALPLTPSGKLDRKALPEPGDLHDVGAERAAPQPRDDRERHLRVIWERIFQRPVGIRDDFFALGGHSLLAASLFAEMEDLFGVRLPLAALFELPTIEHLAAEVGRLLDAEVASGASLPVVGLMQKGAAAPPLICIHGQGGGFFPYMGLVRAASRDRSIFGIRSPWPLPATLDDLGKVYADAILQLVPDGRVHLLGYSLGGALALETARHLTARGARPGLVGILDQPRPDLGRGGLIPTRPDGALRLAIALRHRVATALRVRGARYLGRLARWLGAEPPAPVATVTPVVVDAPYMGRGDVDPSPQLLAMICAYRPRPSAHPFTLFRATLQPFNQTASHDFGWGVIAAGGLEVVAAQGDHATMLKPPHVAALVAAIESRMRRLDQCLPTRSRSSP